ncbi:unnamed protein product [Ceratitis capitata]|uniref:(Mediterranean fruit fly) hypothetical protein n=1 Tax=Ceratitis capitata TaxID=7213 RepID=A0A811UX18_CERCA|nr:unnamed protein product [Ceratitis capitata]
MPFLANKNKEKKGMESQKHTKRELTKKNKKRHKVYQQQTTSINKQNFVNLFRTPIWRQHGSKKKNERRQKYKKTLHTCRRCGVQTTPSCLCMCIVLAENFWKHANGTFPLGFYPFR